MKWNKLLLKLATASGLQVAKMAKIGADEYFFV